eukprot:scaffold133266_cov94-Phaeocystis_antarctica.AAC.4
MITRDIPEGQAELPRPPTATTPALPLLPVPTMVPLGLASSQPGTVPAPPGLTPRVVGMGKGLESKGVFLVRQRHNTDGHCELTKTVLNLRAEGAFEKGKLTMADVQLFAGQGCGSCESAKMRRRPFNVKVATNEPTIVQLGKNWTVDVLTLRTPCANTGAVYVYVAVDRVSKYICAGRMRSYTEESFISAMNDIKARVRPSLIPGLLRGVARVWR